MSFSNTFETSILNLVLAAQNIDEIADNTATSATTELFVALHESDPGEAGTQGTNETSYTGYTRVAVARTTGGWAVSNGSASPVSAITFGQATSTSTGTLTYASIGLTSSTTDGTIIASGAISPSINFSQNVTPSLTTGSSFTLD
jgi:hypothetical protein